MALGVYFFADFQNLLGTLTGAPIVFGWPALFFLRGAALKGARVPLMDRVGCALCLGVALPVLLLAGVSSAVYNIVVAWADPT